jgi:hypothetical protein
MDAAKLINGRRDEVLAKPFATAPKRFQASAARSEAKKVVKRSTGKTERPQVKAIRKSKSERLVCRYCRSDDLAPASSSDEIAGVANVSASAKDRRHGPERRRLRSRFTLVDERGAGLGRTPPLCISGCGSKLE